MYDSLTAEKWEGIICWINPHSLHEKGMACVGISDPGHKYDVQQITSQPITGLRRFYFYVHANLEDVTLTIGQKDTRL